MFIVGLILLLVGACLVYGSKLITRLVPGRGQNQEIKIKLIGLTCAVIGAIILFRNDIPIYLRGQE
ncbi:MAG: hypothetical protein K0R93_2851 [Anaerosolibacter sp.]|jgi:hypothetical protein|uniref:hypothetical protein n=1 Tax=Anaerosolibacter sp. TaxID=1872527 RepID=UPI00262B237F|nr:hypothetical protein [Anaerosolibacter sp.]MDF2547953.1 hypothetical protein [Anaerosolibacter sp.]